MSLSVIRLSQLYFFMTEKGNFFLRFIQSRKEWRKNHLNSLSNSHLLNTQKASEERIKISGLQSWSDYFSPSQLKLVISFNSYCGKRRAYFFETQPLFQIPFSFFSLFLLLFLLQTWMQPIGLQLLFSIKLIFTGVEMERIGHVSLSK